MRTGGLVAVMLTEDVPQDVDNEVGRRIEPGILDDVLDLRVDPPGYFDRNFVVFHWVWLPGHSRTALIGSR